MTHNALENKCNKPGYRGKESGLNQLQILGTGTLSEVHLWQRLRSLTAQMVPCFTYFMVLDERLLKSFWEEGITGRHG